MKGDSKRKAAFAQKLVSLFEENSRDDRITVPLMKTVEMLLTEEYLGEAKLAPELLALHASCVKECNKSKAIVKLMAAVGVFANLLLVEEPELAIKALRSLLHLLYHGFPKVRKLAAEKLYTSLLSLEDYSILIPGGEEETFDAAVELLSETDWSLPQKVLVESNKVQFYACFG